MDTDARALTVKQGWKKLRVLEKVFRFLGISVQRRPNKKATICTPIDVCY